MGLLIIEVQFPKGSLQTLPMFQNFSAVVSGKEVTDITVNFTLSLRSSF